MTLKVTDNQYSRLS